MQQPWLPEKWDKEVDVVVVGFGGVGAAAAITAQDLGAKVLMLEKAPQGEEGGNTRIAGQGYLQVCDVDKAITYLNALCGRYPVPQCITPLVERAQATGFKVLVLTVDVQVAANRENNVRAGYSSPLKPTPRLA